MIFKSCYFTELSLMEFKVNREGIVYNSEKCHETFFCFIRK